ncbi:MAG: TonB-dependent receptor [Steroidobacteraceae bacterium]|nr:TonB-dependent receptor [Steroidobacteraceae bacterium]
MSSLSLFAILAAEPARAVPEAADPIDALSRMSLEDLAKVEVTSVSKSAQSLATAPASIYVITREEILRAGVLSIPEALRLAPNMQVTQLTSSAYQNGARGFAGAPDVQNFSNKILILIDGRSVYSPLFSGIEYDMQDVMMNDIERIEVISGPGATLWGANAMNGVINIITRNAHDSQGLLLRADAGPEEQGLGLRYGGKLGSDGAFRAYAKWFDRGETEFEDGTGAEDHWSRLQLGFRGDLARDRNSFTLQGDYQDGSLSQFNAADFGFSTANLIGRWEHAGERVQTRVQTFLDRVHRDAGLTGIEYDIDTYDIEFQQSLALEKHKLVWGVGRRYYEYETVNTALAFVPDNRTLELTNVFVQDVIELSREVHLTAGVKFEDNSYTDWEVLPDLRLSWTPNASTLLWLAASKAIRAPTPFDTDVQEFVGGQLFVAGNPDFKPEKVTAYELGVRAQPDAVLSFSASAFYNEYDDLRSIELTPVTVFPLIWGNLIEGSSYGFEVWANLQVNSWWRLSPGFRSLHKRLEFSEGSSELVGVAQSGNDPSSRYLLKSSMDFGRVSVDALVRKISRLPQPAVDDYTEVNARVAWQVNDRLELAVKGFNLLNETHREYAAPQGFEVRRNVMAELRYSY